MIKSVRMKNDLNHRSNQQSFPILYANSAR